MQLGQKNPFQNVPGMFIPALPNLAGACPGSCSPGAALFCSFSGAGGSSAQPANPLHHRYHSPAVNSRCCSCHHDDPSSETAELPTASTKEEGCAPDTESPLRSGPSSSSLPPADEIHFDLIISLPSPIEDGAEPEQQQQQQGGPQSSEPSTPTQSDAQSSPTRSDFSSEGPKEEGGKGEEVREKKRKQRKRRRARRQGGRSKLEHGAGSIPPRFWGHSGIHYGLWAQYVCPQAPLPPPVMNHHHDAWSFAGYPGYHHQDGGFVVPSNSPAPLFWNPIVPATGFVGVPVAS